MNEFRNDNSQLNDNFDAVKDDSDDIAVDTVHQPGEAARDAENTAMHDISPEAGIPDVAVRGAASGEEPQTEHRYPYEGRKPLTARPEDRLMRVK